MGNCAGCTVPNCIYYFIIVGIQKLIAGTQGYGAKLKVGKCKVDICFNALGSNFDRLR